MRGHVQKKNGRWYVVLELEREDGKRRQKWISPQKELGLPKPATKPQADKLLVKLLNEMNDGVYVEPSITPFSVFLNRWLEDYCKINLRPTTYDNYESFVKLHIIPEIGHITLANLKPAHIQKLYADKLKGGRLDGKKGGLAPKSIRNMHGVIYEALKHAVKWELLSRNIAEAVTPPRNTEKEVQAWDQSQVRQFLNAIKKDRLYPLYLLALSTGMRRGEILGLRWSDLDLKKGTASIRQNLVVSKGRIVFQAPKTESGKRSISLSPVVAEALSKHRKTQIAELLALEPEKKDTNEPGQNEEVEEKNKLNLVFLSCNGTPIHPRNLTRHFERIIKEEGLSPIAFHSLRHTHATIMLQQGVHPKVVSERLGHSQVGITMDTYSHVLPDMQKEASLLFEKVLS